jgi:hypothetical protein
MNKESVSVVLGLLMLGMSVAGLWSISRAMANGNFLTGGRSGYKAIVSREDNPLTFWISLALAAAGTISAAAFAYRFLSILF